jgi:hypothetical protein
LKLAEKGEEMDEGNTEMDVRKVIRDAIQEFIEAEKSKAAPAYKAELMEERRRREELERRMNDLVTENQRSRAIAEEAERNASIRTELQRLGVAKIDLAYKAIKEDVIRTEDGRLAARTPHGDVSLREYLTHFVNENPELLPARIAGGSGAVSGQKSLPTPSIPLDMERIKPGMSREELDKVRQEVAKIALQSLEGK